MKNKITCLLAGAALFGATANAEIVLTEDLSAYGYIDMALTDGDGTGNTDTAVAEYELGFAFTPAESAWSAVAELSFDGEGVTDFETVTISYQYSDSLSFTFGNILSYQGFETFDATGLYQYSYAGADNTPLYSAGYAVGASADGSMGDIDYGVWIGDDAAGDSGTNSFEYLLAYNGIENLTIKAIVADDPGYDTTNIWASYDYGNFTFAVEMVDTEFDGGSDIVGTYETYEQPLFDATQAALALAGLPALAGNEFAPGGLLLDDLEATMFMVYYAMGDAGLTVRFTDGTYTGNIPGLGGLELDYEKFTISPSYAFSDNVFGLIEFSSEEISGAGVTVDNDTAAVELIYSF